MIPVALLKMSKGMKMSLHLDDGSVPHPLSRVSMTKLVLTLNLCLNLVSDALQSLIK